MSVRPGLYENAYSSSCAAWEIRASWYIPVKVILPCTGTQDSRPDGVLVCTCTSIIDSIYDIKLCTLYHDVHAHTIMMFLRLCTIMIFHGPLAGGPSHRHCDCQ